MGENTGNKIQALKGETGKLWKCLLKSRVTLGLVQGAAAAWQHHRNPNPPSPSPENPREPHSVTSNFILIPSEKFKNYTKKYFSLCYLLTKNTPQNYKLFSGFAGVGAVGGGGGGWFVHFE